MSDDPSPIVFLIGFAMGALAVSVVFAISLPKLPDSTQLEAVMAGSARWVGDDNGYPKLEWVVPKATNSVEKPHE